MASFFIGVFVTFVPPINISMGIGGLSVPGSSMPTTLPMPSCPGCWRRVLDENSYREFKMLPAVHAVKHENPRNDGRVGTGNRLRALFEYFPSFGETGNIHLNKGWPESTASTFFPFGGSTLFFSAFRNPLGLGTLSQSGIPIAPHV